MFSTDTEMILMGIIVVLLTVIGFLIGREKPSGRVNSQIQMDSKKVVNFVDCQGCAEIEELANNAPEKMSGGPGNGKLVMCRCWKSSTFPYCDGSHTQHNKETGDNVGPV